MKMKKIIAAIAASAVSMTALAAVSLSAFAEETTISYTGPSTGAYKVEGTETQSCTITDGAVVQMVVTNNKDVPDTSDNSKNGLWLVLLSISAIILVGGAYIRFKASK